MTEPLILLGAALAFALAMLMLNIKTSRYSWAAKSVSYVAMWGGFILATMALGRIAIEVLA